MLETGLDTFVVSALGPVGTGKSSLLNAITGEYAFETGDGTDVDFSSKTLNASYWPLFFKKAKTREVEGKTLEWKFAPSTKYCHLIDTPGLVDSNLQDRQSIQEMTRYFRSLENGVSAFFLVFNINDIR